MRRTLLGLLALMIATTLHARAAFDPLTPQTPVNVFEFQRTPVGAQLWFDAPELAWESLADGDMPVLAGAGEEYIASAPRLPVYSRLIAVPDGMDLRLKDVRARWVDKGARQLAWNNGAKEDATLDEAAYERYSQELQEVVEVSETGRWRDLRIAHVIVRPMQYDASTSQVLLAEDLEIEFDFVPSMDDDGYDPPGVSEALLPLYRGYVLGAEDELDEDLDEIGAPQRGTYLIIAPSAFASLTDEYVAWKTQLGYNVVVANTGVTGTSYSDIHDYLDEQYETLDPPLDYVLLLGDEDTPSNITAPTVPGSPFYNQYVAADHKYTYETGQTSIAGVMPRYLVGRLSVDNITQANTVLTKTLFYEKTPGDEGVGLDRFENAMFIACLNPGISTGMTKRWVASKMLADGGITDVEDLYDSYSNPLSLTTVTNTINSGVSWINYRGYGSYTGWSGPYWGNSQMNGLQNDFENPIVTSMVCGGTAFDRSQADPCFAENFVRFGSPSAPKGAVAFAGPSELDTHTRWNNAMDGGWYQSMYEFDLETLGQCMFGAKLEMLRCYPNSWNANGNATNSVWFYWHTYNIIGDPGLQVRREIPMELDVDHPAGLADQDSYFPVHVTNSQHQPLADMRVVITEDETGIVATGLTDANGNLNLELPGGPYGDDLTVAVTRRDVVPYVEELDGLGSVGLEMESITLVEDPDHNNNNGDGQVNPGEVAFVEGEFTVQQTGGIDNLSVTVSLPIGGGEVIDTVQTFGDVAQGATVDLTDIVMSFDPEIQYQQPIELEFAFEGDDFAQSHLYVYDDIAAPGLEISDFAFAGEWHPGDVGELTIELTNLNPSLASGEVTGTLVSLNPFAIPIQANVTWNNIPGGGSATPTSEFTVLAADNAYPGRMMPLTLQLETEDGYQTYLDIVLSVDGGDQPESPTGPAGPGYYMFEFFSADEFDTGTPMMIEWDYESLNGVGNQVGGLSDNGNNQDKVTDVNLPFEFPYWGEDYDQITICSNGWLSFEEEENPYFRNRPIPGPLTPLSGIFPLWDDLKLGQVYTYHNQEEGWFGIEWYNWVHYNGGSSMRFQVRLLDPEEWDTIGGQGIIVMMYDQVYNNDGSENYATVGITSPNANEGIQYTFANEDDPTAHGIENAISIIVAIGEGGGLEPANLQVQPPVIHAALQEGDSTEAEIILRNDGDSGLSYNMLIEGIWPDWSLENPGMDGVPGGKDGNADELDERGGPDGFGYRYIDSDSRFGPIEDWLDITIDENLVEMSGEPEEPALSGEIEMPFEFSFYGEQYTGFWICDAGYMVFIDPEGEGEVINTDLPRDYSPLAGIFPFWDNISLGDDGSVYAKAYTDSMVVTWSSLEHNIWTTNNGPYTFQVMLTSDGAIHIRYADEMHPSYRSCTVGIQNHTGEQGSTVRFGQEAETYIRNDLTIRFTPPPFFHLTYLQGELEGREVLPLSMDISAEHYNVGTCHSRMIVWSDDTEQVYLVPGQLNVTENPPSAAPRISHLTGEAALIGQNYHSFPLDPCVFDTAYADDEITWTVYGDPAVDVTIDEDRIAHPSKVDTLWTGQATITYRATNPALAYTEKIVTYSTGGANNAPRFETVTPGDIRGLVNIDSTIDFSATVSDPDEDEITLTWYHGEENLGEGDGVTVSFEEIGYDSVYVIADDGTSHQTHTWWVNVWDLSAPEGVQGLPTAFALESLYPNPFNSSLVVSYALPRTADVELRVFNLLGQEVTRQQLIQMPAGRHKIALDGKLWASGTYFLAWKAGGVYEVRKAVLLK